MADRIAELREAILREPESFDIHEDPDPNFDWLFRIWFKRKDHPSHGIRVKDASAIADQIRPRHPSVADKIVKCVERAQRYAKDSHRTST